MISKKHKTYEVYDVSLVPQATRYWRDKLLAYCLNLFVYDGLPDSLPAREIESNNIVTGHCVFFIDKHDGQIVTCQTELYGFDRYYNPTHAIFAQPRLLSRSLDLNSDKVSIMYNSVLNNQVLGEYVDGSLMTFINRYARMFADIESTFSISTVNERTPFIPSTNDSDTRESVEEFYEKIALGQRTVVADDNIIPALKMIETSSAKSSTTKPIDHLYARDKLFECFMREIGIFFYQTKRAQVNVAEVDVNSNMCTFMIDDMLKARQKGVKELNSKFGLNVTVEINQFTDENFIDEISDKGAESNDDKGLLQRDSDDSVD